MTRRENLLRAARFESPEYIPVSFAIGPVCWDHYPAEALEELMASHPLLFPGFEKRPARAEPSYAPWRRADGPYTDSWGCVWETVMSGITGAVVQRPLEDWSALDQFAPPDPEQQDGWGPIDWDKRAESIESARSEGRLTQGGLRHGHTFLTITYLRGYENALFDMADDEAKLHELIAMIENFNLAIVQRYLELGVEWVGYPEDLGMQVGPMLSPGHFREYITPSYRRLMQPARDAGCVVHMHSDGDIRELALDIVDAGVQVLNLQDLVNGIDWIREHLKGRICIDLDLDRQNITRFGTPDQIDPHVREAVEKLGSVRGGLMLRHGLHPGIPLENVKALMDAMEKYAAHYS